MLAFGMLPDDHNNDNERAAIDDFRRQLGGTMSKKWTEATWVSTVPVNLRGAHTKIRPGGGKDPSQIEQTSYEVVRDLLLNGNPTIHLDHSVFYVASGFFRVGVFVIVHDSSADGPVISCRHVGESYLRHIVVLHSSRNGSGHYDCVQMGNDRVFATSHELVVALKSLVASHPVTAAQEDDIEQARLALPITPSSSPPAVTASPSSLLRERMRGGGKLIHIKNVFCRPPEIALVAESLLNLALFLSFQQEPVTLVHEHADGDTEQQTSMKAISRIDVIISTLKRPSKEVSICNFLWGLSIALREFELLPKGSPAHQSRKDSIREYVLENYESDSQDKLTLVNKHFAIFAALSREPDGFLYYLEKTPFVFSAIDGWAIRKLYDRDLMDLLIRKLYRLADDNSKNIVNNNKARKRARRLVGSGEVKKAMKTVMTPRDGGSESPAKQVKVDYPSVGHNPLPPDLRFGDVCFGGERQYGIFAISPLLQKRGGKKTVLGAIVLDETKEPDLLDKTKESDRLDEKKESERFTMTVQGRDLDLSNQWIGYINHSPKANVSVTESGQLIMDSPCIAEGEELRLDYGKEYWVYQVTGCDIVEWKGYPNADRMFTFMHQNVDDYSSLLSTGLSTLETKEQRLSKLEALLHEECKYVIPPPNEGQDNSDSSPNRGQESGDSASEGGHEDSGSSPNEDSNSSDDDDSMSDGSDEVDLVI